MKIDNKYYRFSKAFFTLLMIFILLAVVVIPSVNAKILHPDGGKVKVGGYWWTRGDPLLASVPDDVYGFMDTLADNNEVSIEKQFDVNNDDFKPETIIQLSGKNFGDSKYLEKAEVVYFAGHGGKKPNCIALNLPINDKPISYLDGFKREKTLVFPFECSWGDEGVNE